MVARANPDKNAAIVDICNVVVIAVVSGKVCLANESKLSECLTKTMYGATFGACASDTHVRLDASMVSTLACP